jgi:hypothetical protein
MGQQQFLRPVSTRAGRTAQHSETPTRGVANANRDRETPFAPAGRLSLPVLWHTTDPHGGS